jgi:broad specificity phosphatase PhoE
MNLIKKIEKNNKTALLIRHADRNKIPEGTFGEAIELNTRGKQNAFLFGEKLTDFKLNKVFTSPVKRCVQTAKQIVKAYKQTVDIELSNILGEPGAFVEDMQKAGEYFLKFGAEKMYQDYVSGKSIPGFRGHEGYKILYQFLVENTKNEGITLFVTHDILIANFDFHHSGKIYSKENWIPFLNGLILNF